MLVPSAAWSAAATVASATAASAVASATSAAATSAASRTSASPAPVWTVSMRTVAAANMRRAFAVEVGLVAIRRLIRKIAATFDHHGAGGSGLTLDRSNCAFRRRSAATHLRALFFQDRLARQTDTVAFHCENFHQHLVAFFQLVANIGNSMLRHFADVQQAVGSRNNLDERAEIREARDFPEISLPYFRGRRQVADNLQRLRRGRLIARRDFDQAGIFHIDLDSGLFHDAANHLSARPDQIANLIDRDLHGVEARSEVGNLLAPSGNNLF